MLVDDVKRIDQLLEEIVKLANANAVKLGGAGVDAVFAIMDENEMVFGVWQDTGQKYGVGCRLVKGHEHMQISMATGQTFAGSLTGIRCRSEEEAMALEQVYAERTLTQS